MPFLVFKSQCCFHCTNQFALSMHLILRKVSSANLYFYSEVTFKYYMSGLHYQEMQGDDVVCCGLSTNSIRFCSVHKVFAIHETNWSFGKRKMFRSVEHAVRWIKFEFWTINWIHGKAVFVTTKDMKVKWRRNTRADHYISRTCTGVKSVQNFDLPLQANNGPSHAFSHLGIREVNSTNLE